MSTINVTNLSGRGGATPNLPDGANVTGVVTATSFDGSLKTTGTPTLGLGVTINASGINVSGVLTATSFKGDGSGLTGVGETIAPWYYNPDVSQVDAYVNTGIGITFNKKILAGAGGSMTLRLVGAAGTVVQNWGVSSITVPDATSFNASLVSELENNTTYHLTVGSGFIVDNSGTSYVGTAYTFDTSDSVDVFFAWGMGGNGELNNNQPAIRQSSPVQIPGTTWTNLWDSGNRGGGETFGAIKTDGTLWTWGNGAFGATGTNGPDGRGSSPVQVPGTWNQTYGTFSGSYISAGALKADGTLWMWGNNGAGMLGQNNTTRVSSPVQVPGTTWSRLAFDGRCVLANKTDGTLWAWGENDYGMSGSNNRTEYSSPIQIPGTNWATGKISVGDDHVGAIKTDGTLWVWGNGAPGQLGHNNTTQYSSPVQVPGTTWATVTMGESSVMASKTDGTLWAWGNNNNGVLGQNNAHPTGTVSSPIQIPGTTWSTSMNHYTMTGRAVQAAKTDGTLWTWGYNDKGQLGLSDVAARSSPTQVPGISGVQQVVCWTDGMAALYTDSTP